MSHEGLTAAPFALIGIFLGSFMPITVIAMIIADESWTFNFNTLSDLGVSSNEMVSLMFNGGCMLGGLLMSIVGIGRALIREERLDKTCGAVLALAGIFLFLVGIFTKDCISIHEAVALLYFLLILAAMIISIAADYKMGRVLTATLTSILIVITIASVPGFFFAGFEVIMVGCTYVWMTAQGLSLAFSKN